LQNFIDPFSFNHVLVFLFKIRRMSFLKTIFLSDYVQQIAHRWWSMINEASLNKAIRCASWLNWIEFTRLFFYTIVYAPPQIQCCFELYKARDATLLTHEAHRLQHCAFQSPSARMATATVEKDKLHAAITPRSHRQSLQPLCVCAGAKYLIVTQKSAARTAYG
jgi:hypothetical protein